MRVVDARRPVVTWAAVLFIPSLAVFLLAAITFIFSFAAPPWVIKYWPTAIVSLSSVEPISTVRDISGLGALAGFLLALACGGAVQQRLTR